MLTCCDRHSRPNLLLPIRVGATEELFSCRELSLRPTPIDPLPTHKPSQTLFTTMLKCSPCSMTTLLQPCTLSLPCFRRSATRIKTRKLSDLAGCVKLTHRFDSLSSGILVAGCSVRTISLQHSSRRRPLQAEMGDRWIWFCLNLRSL